MFVVPSPVSYHAFIEKMPNSGWLNNVKLDSGAIVSLPEYLRVMVHPESNHLKEYITILEGVHRGKKASGKRKGLTINDFHGSYFDVEHHTKRGCPHKGAAQVVFYQKSNRLKITSIGEFSTYIDTNTYLPTGVYDLQLPDYPHTAGNHYAAHAPHAKTWFKIGNNGNRYLHFGNRSNGNIVVEEIIKWEIIYKHLIVARKGLDNVGTITIINQ